MPRTIAQGCGNAIFKCSNLCFECLSLNINFPFCFLSQRSDIAWSIISSDDLIQHHILLS